MPYLLKRVINVQRVTCVTNDVMNKERAFIVDKKALGFLAISESEGCPKRGPADNGHIS